MESKRSILYKYVFTNCGTIEFLTAAYLENLKQMHDLKTPAKSTFSKVGLIIQIVPWAQRLKSCTRTSDAVFQMDKVFHVRNFWNKLKNAQY